MEIEPGPEPRASGHAQLVQAEAAEVDGGLAARLLEPGAEHRDHAARTVAVEHRERPAQDLDALRAGKVEVRHLALAVGHRRRNAIGVQAHAAHAETGASAEAA